PSSAFDQRIQGFSPALISAQVVEAGPGSRGGAFCPASCSRTNSGSRRPLAASRMHRNQSVGVVNRLPRLISDRRPKLTRGTGLFSSSDLFLQRQSRNPV